MAPLPQLICVLLGLVAAVAAVDRSTPPEECLTVSVDGEGEYSSFADAVGAVAETGGDACIFLYPGTYEGQVAIDYENSGNLTIYGSTMETSNYKQNTALVTNTLSSPDAGSLDASATLLLESDNVSIYNVNFENGYGEGAQAVAVSASGNNLGFYGCAFYGYQDTLYAKDNNQYYSNCYIEGAVDFIFGAAGAWFGECTVASNGGGYITANSREEEDDTSWYVFDHSTITAAEGISVDGEVYLGRPWRGLSRVIYQNSELTAVVHPEGWTTMAEGATPVYEEWENTGDGSDTSERLYLTEAAGAVTKEQLFGSDWKKNLGTSSIAKVRGGDRRGSESEMVRTVAVTDISRLFGGEMTEISRRDAPV
ncbi:hypothetical protein FQN54_008970 [Arachnomyces sp. PD_36]|nr:hypothetical protein FQN54_008970 [Arachnomyces sp. PD_36]